MTVVVLDELFNLGLFFTDTENPFSFCFKYYPQRRLILLNFFEKMLSTLSHLGAQPCSILSCFCTLASERRYYSSRRRLQKIRPYCLYPQLFWNDPCIPDKSSSILNPSFDSTSPGVRPWRTCSKDLCKFCEFWRSEILTILDKYLHILAEQVILR